MKIAMMAIWKMEMSAPTHAYAGNSTEPMHFLHRTSFQHHASGVTDVFRIWMAKPQDDLKTADAIVSRWTS
jgi:hypothetical protein